MHTLTNGNLPEVNEPTRGSKMAMGLVGLWRFMEVYGGHKLWARNGIFLRVSLIIKL